MQTALSAPSAAFAEIAQRAPAAGPSQLGLSRQLLLQAPLRRAVCSFVYFRQCALKKWFSWQDPNINSNLGLRWVFVVSHPKFIFADFWFKHMTAGLRPFGHGGCI